VSDLVIVPRVIRVAHLERACQAARDAGISTALESWPPADESVTVNFVVAAGPGANADLSAIEAEVDRVLSAARTGRWPWSRAIPFSGSGARVGRRL
jgi:hypothetical protein